MTEFGVLFSFILAGLLASCATVSKNENQLLLSEDFSFASPKEINRSQMRNDILHLIHFLKNGYGGRGYIPKSQLEETISKLQSIDQSPVAISVGVFCEKVDEALLSINDAHLAARWNGDNCSPLREQRKRQVFVGKNIHQQEKPPWLKTDLKVHLKRISIISINAFPKHEDEVWKGFLDAVLDAKSHSDGIILDLRGNGGGDDTMGLAMADYLYGQDHPASVEYQVKSQSPETMAMLFNNYQSRILRLNVKNQQIPDYLVKRREEARAKFDSAVNGLIPHEEKVITKGGFPFDPQKGYAKPILILTDRDCVSSCESTLEAFESHPFVTTIGTNTGGFCHFGNMGLVVLPSSKVTVQMATDFWVYKDGRFVENIGYPPKVGLNDGQDAMVEAKKIMTKILSQRQ